MTLKKRSISVGGHPTSVTLEDAFWDGLHEIAAARKQTLSALVTEIDKKRKSNLSSALRVFILEYYKN